MYANLLAFSILFSWLNLGGVDLLLTTAWPSGLDQKLEDDGGKWRETLPLTNLPWENRFW